MLIFRYLIFFRVQETETYVYKTNHNAHPGDLYPSRTSAVVLTKTLDFINLTILYPMFNKPSSN